MGFAQSHFPTSMVISRKRKDGTLDAWVKPDGTNTTVDTPPPKRQALEDLRIQNRNQSHTAWVQLPKYDQTFTCQFSRELNQDQPFTTALSPDSSSEDEIVVLTRSYSKTCAVRPIGTTKSVEKKAVAKTLPLRNVSTQEHAPASHNGRKSRRQTSTIDYTSQIFDLESSDSDSPPVRWKQTHAKPSPKQPDSESDFDEKGGDDGIESSISEDDDVDVVDSSEPSSASESEEESKSKGKSYLAKPKAALAAAPASVPSLGKSKNMTNLFRKSSEPRGLSTNLPPLSEIGDIFQDLVQRANGIGFHDAVRQLESKKLRVATMCSGTESPLLAIEMIRNSLRVLNAGELTIEHLFSGEIVPYKQAYIERNFHPPIIFRDITELVDVIEDETPMATTAFGGKVAVPMEVDILIAGTSCVDFSRLNSFKKTIDGGGESGKTWQAVLSYCTQFRPTIIILENVKTAQWDTMLNQFEAINYESAGVFVDSKDYYIPHTRQRGYMVCFDRIKTETVGLKNAGLKWKSTMEKLRRPASSPINSFLSSSSQNRPQMQTDDQPGREVDWDQCELTQGMYRHEERLGHARPYTNWQESGSVLPPDNTAMRWFPDQVERVLDTIDGCLLRKALPKNGMYDVRFKTRIWNLSQNIYRDEDRQPFGITGCITPTGIFYLSDVGRVLAPEEALKLQGLPLDNISFTTESPAEMQDLAGNAMTTTVIGAAILSALIAGSSTISAPRITGPSTSPEAYRPIRNDHSTDKIVTTTGPVDLNVPELIAKGRRSLRRCFCEGTTSLAEHPIQKCKDCGHTACIACGGNPEHSYSVYNGLNESRLTPSMFEEYLLSTLPLALEIEAEASFPRSKSKEFTHAVEDSTKTMFTFQDVKRTSCWTITYRSRNARLDLVISDSQAQWRLYALPDKSVPGNSELRAMLEQPIATAAIVKSLLNVNWLWRVPAKTIVPMKVKHSGPAIASWWSHNQMPDFKLHTVSEQLDIEIDCDENQELSETINGTYKYLPRCGKACNSLFRKLTGDKTSQVFLFLDPTRTGTPDKDCFVFSTILNDLEYNEVRPIIARVEAPWKPWAHAQNPSKPSCIIDESWVASKSVLRAVNLKSSVTVPRKLEDLGRVSSCSQLNALVQCEMFKPSDAGPAGQQIIKADNVRFFADNAWIFQVIRRCLPQRLGAWQSLQTVKVADCDICAPAVPAIRWKQGDGDKDSIQPYEDQQSAAHYERKIKARPEAILLEVDENLTKMQVTLGLNIASLAHRSVAQLARTLSRAACTNADIECSWRFVTGSPSSDFAFKPFKLRSTTDVLPYSADVGMSVRLFPKQCLVLAWMRKQESGVTFKISNVEEARIPQLGWRAEVKAQTDVQVRGGICADHPGFGKTITSIALIQTELNECGDSKQILSRLISRQGQNEKVKNLIPSAATLIICPQTLMKQWASEIEEKLGSSKGVITINQTSHLSRSTLEDFRNAKIIIVNRSVLGSESYAERLAAFAAFPPPFTTSGRRFSQWLKFATEQVPIHLELLKQEGKASLKTHIVKKYQENLASERFKAVIPSKRLKGAAFAAEMAKKSGGASTSKTKAKSKGAASSTINTTNLDTPLFEMFYFNRLIVDEFHQYEQREYASIVGLKSDSRWGLSATPALGDFYDISQIAGLLGVPLPIGSDQRGIMKAKNRRDLRKDMTDFEHFDTMRQIPTLTMHERIHEMDQRFLDTFVRQNIMDFDELKLEDHLVPVTLDLAHITVYSELSQHLNSTSMRIKKTTKSKSADRQVMINDAVSSSLTAEEALSKAAAYSDTFDIAPIIEHRRKQLNSMMKELPAAIADARSNEKEYFDGLWRRHSDDMLGDAETTKDIMMLMGGQPPALNSKQKKTSAKEEDDTASSKKKSPREKTAALNSKCSQLVVAKRSLRYLENVDKLKRSSNPARLCDSPTSSNCRHSNSTPSEVAVSAYCGHIICKHCLSSMKSSGHLHCPAEGCSALLSDHHLLWHHKMGNPPIPSSNAGGGAKLLSTISLLRKIASQKDQAVLFVQFPNQLSQVEEALRDGGISATIVKSLGESAEQIRSFREDAGIQGKHKTVIVLNASDETAAGSNLQNANHVIFLSPLLRDSRYGYESTMAQAIGRVRRHGQKKGIHVYRICALDTIDVDVLEHRERRGDALVEVGEEGIADPGSGNSRNGEGKKEIERTQLVRENGKFSLRPRSWLVGDGKGDEEGKWKGKNRVRGWEDFSSLIKFSRTFTEDD